MNPSHQVCCTAFAGSMRISTGGVAQVASATKEAIDRGEAAPVLIFDDVTGELIEIDFRGTVDEVLKRLAQRIDQGAIGACSAAGAEEAPRRPGRPKLGVVAHEVTLLPRHWDWLNSQPGGASVALRKLVEQARRANRGRDQARLSQEAANRFMSAMAGNLAGFEEATRALFAGMRARFDELVEPWPADVRDYAKQLAAVALRTPSADDEKPMNEV